MAIAAGTRLGPYEIVQSIGAGGMGEVYRARDGRLNRDVAVKILPEDVARDPERLDRFEREARASAALNHPNIIAIYDIGHADGPTFMVMEILDGATLRHELTTHPPTQRKAWSGRSRSRTDSRRRTRAASSIATSSRRISSSRPTDASRSSTSASRKFHRRRSQRDRAGDHRRRHRIGQGARHRRTTCRPSRCAAKPIDARSDIFALGAVLYEMLAGRRAFSGDTRSKRCTRSSRRTRPTLKDSQCQVVSTGSSGAVSRSAPRTGSTRLHDLALALEAVSGSRTQPVAPVAASNPRRRGMLMAGMAAAVLLAAAAASAGWWFAQRSSVELPTIRQVTTRRGSISAARFSAAGDSVLYSARFGGSATAPFETRLNSREGRQVGPSNSLMLSASAGTLALGLNAQTEAIWQKYTLASLPPGASVARELLQDVMDADFVGDRLAAIEYSGNGSLVHFPVGNVVYRTPGTSMRFVRRPTASRSQSSTRVRSISSTPTVTSLT